MYREFLLLSLVWYTRNGLLYINYFSTQADCFQKKFDGFLVVPIELYVNCIALVLIWCRWGGNGIFVYWPSIHVLI
jgi:hypothetical protein